MHDCDLDAFELKKLVLVQSDIAHEKISPSTARNLIYKNISSLTTLMTVFQERLRFSVELAWGFSMRMEGVKECLEALGRRKELKGKQEIREVDDCKR